MHIDANTAQQILSAKKVAGNWTGFRPKENHRGLVLGLAILFDGTGASIPGLTLQLELRTPTIVNDCLFTFSIFQRFGTTRRRIYQLEICPGDKLSHNGEETIYGPHEHTPDGEVRAVRESGVDCENWSAGLAWFLSRTNIEPFDLEQPC
jgi:hypothetical protein